MDLGIDLVLVSDLTRREDARFVDTHPGSLALRDAGAQVLKTLCRLGHRLGYIPEDITTDFEMPRVPKTIVPTFPTSSSRRCSRSPPGGPGWAPGTERSCSSLSIP